MSGDRLSTCEALIVVEKGEVGEGWVDLQSEHTVPILRIVITLRFRFPS